MPRPVPEPTRFAAAVRRGLKVLADPTKSGPMQAYMKSEMPYWGVQTPARRVMMRKLIREIPLADYDNWRGTVEMLWDGASHREERYCAIDLVDARTYDEHQKLESFPLYTHMIVTGAWWDLVDPIATHRLRHLLDRSPKRIEKEMRTWSRSDDLWQRRSAIICQIGRKEDTDLELLYKVIRDNWDSREFFIRKAIGWALRDYAWSDPDEVRRFVRKHETDLSPLSRREATKNL